MAMAAVDKLGNPAACAGIRIVSMPSRELFLAQPKPIRDTLLPPGVRVVVAEAGIAMGWERIARPEDILSIERFGESGPGDDVAKELGFTVDALVKLIAK
jgi:transketolase